MKIHFTKKEYRALVDMLCIADWMLNSRSIGESDFPQHEALRKRLFALSEEMGVDDIIEKSQEFDDYFETQAYDQYLHNEMINPYEDNVFWDALSDRLARRDLVREKGEEAVVKMDGLERAQLLSEKAEQYENEFTEYGLENLKLERKELNTN